MKKEIKKDTITNVVSIKNENEISNDTINNVSKDNEIISDTINNVVANEKVIKKEIIYAEASAYMRNRISHKNFKKEFLTLNGARWMLLQEIGRMAPTDTPFTYTVKEAKDIIDTNKEFITPTK